MSYTKHEFKSGEKLFASQLNEMDEQIYKNSKAISILEPADDDIPKVYFTGTLPNSKGDGDVQVKIHYISKTADFIYPATLKVQGDTSSGYPKKNFTLKLYEDETYENKKKVNFKGWGEFNKFVLKAHWIDRSHVRNVGTAKIWGKIMRSRSDFESLPEELRTAPNNGATDGFTCKVFANGVYQGLYEWIVPKDKLFGQDSDVATHSILNSESNSSNICAFATETTGTSGWSEELQDTKSGEISASFARFITFVATSSDDDFVANAETYFDVQSVIDFNIFARVFCIVDNLCKNQIFYTYDGQKWYEGAWDLDGVLGLQPVGGSFFSYNTEFQTGYIAYKDHSVINKLYDRVEKLFTSRLKARYSKLRNSVLAVENIIDVYERLTDVITTYDGLLSEDYASTTGGGAFTGIPYKAENTIQQIRNFIAQRIPYMDGVIANLGQQEIHCTGVTLSADTLTFTAAGTQTLTATVTPEGCTDYLVWATNNANVATVSGGVVTAISNGSATITVTCGEYSASCVVNVSGISSGETDEPSEDIDYTFKPFEGMEWESGYSYNPSTGIKTATANEHCTDKVINTQNCTYRISGGQYTEMFVWDENDQFVLRIGGTEVTVPKGYKFAIKSYNNTGAFDPSVVSVVAVDNSTSPYLEIPLASLGWKTTTNNAVEASLDGLKVENIDSSNYLVVIGASTGISSSKTMVFSVWNKTTLVVNHPSYPKNVEGLVEYFTSINAKLILNHRQK